jgi:hypothetical protein
MHPFVYSFVPLTLCTVNLYLVLCTIKCSRHRMYSTFYTLLHIVQHCAVDNSSCVQDGLHIPAYSTVYILYTFTLSCELYICYLQFLPRLSFPFTMLSTYVCTHRHVYHMEYHYTMKSLNIVRFVHYVINVFFLCMYFQCILYIPCPCV